MRYVKGGIALNRTRDYPLLRQVLRSQFVLHRQLYELMWIAGHERSRHSFAWRVRRLLRHGQLSSQQLAPFGSELIYSITPLVAQQLQADGECCLFSLERGKANQVHCLHALDLNEIHLSLLRSGISASWMYAAEVRCQNELGALEYAKDYDAIVRFGSDGARTRFALEYERTPKAAYRYDELAHLLAQEKLVDCILYLTSNWHLLNYVSRNLSKCRGRVYLGLVQDWHRCRLDIPVVSPGSYSPVTFRHVLSIPAAAPGSSSTEAFPHTIPKTTV